MKRALCCLCGVFTIGTASATVYDGTYTSDITVVNDSLIEKNSIFDSGGVYVDSDKTLTISDNVQFINGASIRPNPYNKYSQDSYNLILDGNNTVFRSNGNYAIYAGGIRNRTVANINIFINGNNTLFDNNINKNTSYSYGGTIYLGVSNSRYYVPDTRYKQILTINGENTIFSNNSASYGGAIYSNSGIIKANKPIEFYNNSATWGGGALYITNNNTRRIQGKLELSDGSMFISNVATNGSGGAIYNEGSYVRIGADTIFRGNTTNKNGGALYNDGNGALMEINTGNTAVHFETASDSIYNNGGTITFLGTGLIDAGLTSLTSVQGDSSFNMPVINLGRTSAVFDTVNLSDNTTLKTTVWADGLTVKAGNISANTFNIQNNDELKLQITVENRNILSPDGSIVTILSDRSGNQSTGWDYFGNSEKHPKFVVANNLLYDIEFISDGVYKITPKAYANPDPSDDGDVVDNVASAWNMAGFKSGSAAENIANQLYRLSQYTDTLPEYNAALYSIMPDNFDVARNVIINNTNAGLRFLTQRMNMGKTGFWANGGYKALDNGDAYNGHSFGGSFGQDIAFMNGIFTLGQAFGYAQTNVNNKVREYNIQNNFDLSLYGRLSIPIGVNDVYFDAIASHGAYSINENKNVLGYGVDSDLDATQTSAQGNIGIKHGLFGGDIGYRYTNIQRGGYTDSIDQHVNGIGKDISYALARLYIAGTDGVFQWGAHIGSELPLGDKDSYSNIATAPNGQRYMYTIKTNNDIIVLFGANIDLTLSARMTLGLVYDGLISGGYSEHSGKLRFNWTI